MDRVTIDIPEKFDIVLKCRATKEQGELLMDIKRKLYLSSEGEALRACIYRTANALGLRKPANLTWIERAAKGKDFIKLDDVTKIAKGKPVEDE